jgi:hypothetical protein
MSTVAPPAPPIPPTPAPRTPPPSGPSSVSRAIAIVMIVIGGLVVAALVVMGTLSAIAAASVHEETRTLAVADVDELEVDVSGGSLDIVYADVPEARLEIQRVFGNAPWKFQVDGGTLKVASPDRFFGGGWPFGGNGSGTLTLPTSLRDTPLDASMDVAGGSLSVRDGVFGDLSTETDAGSLDIRGTARTLDSETNAGDTTLRLSDVDKAEFSVSAGRMTTELTGSAPRSITADVSAGSLDLAVPRGAYAVTNDVSAGGFDNGIGSTAGATNTLHVEVSAGSASLDYARG